QSEDVQVSRCDVVVSHGGPEHALPQQLGVHIEDRSLVFRVKTRTIRIVPQHQPKVGIAAGGVVIIGVTDGSLVTAGGAGVADYPNARRLRRSRNWRCHDELVWPANEGVLPAAN